MKKSILDSKIFLTLLAIFAGFLLGSIILMAGRISPIYVWIEFFKSTFGKPSYLIIQFIYAAPYVLTGLSVAFAFKTGIFNIGAEGQFVVGEIVAMLLGCLLNLPPIIHGIVCILGGAIAGFIWASFVSIMKIKKQINEVLSFIMFNWIAFYLSKYVVMRPKIHHAILDGSKEINDSARILLPEKWCRLLQSEVANWGIVIAVVLAVVVFIVLEKTTLGFNFKAVGYNSDAAVFAGINSKKSIFYSVGISGALAGIGGAIEVVGMNGFVPLFATQEGFGFDGITVALISCTNPLGCILSGFFYSIMKFGGRRLSIVGAPKEIVNIIMGCVVIFIAISNVFILLRKKVAQNG